MDDSGILVRNPTEEMRKAIREVVEELAAALDPDVPRDFSHRQAAPKPPNTDPVAEGFRQLLDDLKSGPV